MISNFEAIQRRISCRTFTDQPVEIEKKTQLIQFFTNNTEGPFGNQVRFLLADFSEINPEQIKKLGTYGVVKGASLFIVGRVTNSPTALFDYGYCMEKNILFATKLELGTCWLGASFKRKEFGKLLPGHEGDILPAISPVGYTACRKSLIESVLKSVANSKNRKPWNQLFFQNDFKNPLPEDKEVSYYFPLQAVRLAPSAYNLQPWRIIMDSKHSTVHFFVRRVRMLESFQKAMPFQDLDMGIAMTHYESTAEEMGLKGQWERKKPRVHQKDFQYIVSWTAK